LIIQHPLFKHTINIIARYNLQHRNRLITLQLCEVIVKIYERNYIIHVTIIKSKSSYTKWDRRACNIFD